MSISRQQFIKQYIKPYHKPNDNQWNKFLWSEALKIAEQNKDLTNFEVIHWNYNESEVV